MISFNVRKAAKYLMDNGVVYTIRGRRTEGWHDLHIFNKLQRERVYVELVAMAFDTPLASYVTRSGFSTVSEWKDAAESVHKRRINGMGIYRVTLAGRKK